MFLLSEFAGRLGAQCAPAEYAQTIRHCPKPQSFMAEKRMKSRLLAKFAGAALIKEFNLVTPFWGTSKTEPLKIKAR
jgi:hypothetical protein